MSPDQFTQLLSAISANVAADGSSAINKVDQVTLAGRNQLLATTPSWYCAPASVHAAGTLALPRWSDTVLGAPVSKDELQLNTVGSKDLALLLKASYSSAGRVTGAWTTCRATFVTMLAQLYVSACILSMIACNSFANAARAAASRAHEQAVAAASTLPVLGSAVIASRRALVTGGANEALRCLLVSIDNAFMPSRLDAHSRWQTLAVEPGESAAAFVKRVYDLSVEFDKSDEEALLQIETCIEKATAQLVGADATPAIMLGNFVQSAGSMSKYHRWQRSLVYTSA